MKTENPEQIHRKAIRKEVPRLRYWQTHGGNSDPFRIIRERFSGDLSPKAIAELSEQALIPNAMAVTRKGILLRSRNDISFP